MTRADLVTVFHNDTNYRQHQQLFEAIARHEPAGGLRLIGVDNRVHNRGFAAGCNLGAFHPQATAPIIGFLNPDAEIHGPFIDGVARILNDSTVITGCRYDKPDHELKLWGVDDWVCGAAMFVQRKWFAGVQGFDEQFQWGYDETDLIRQAQADGYRCRSLALPIEHHSPTNDSAQDSAYKRFHFAEGQKRFYRKWGPVSAV